MVDERLVVAIDGPVGSGKTTVARLVAKKLGMTLVDTGAIYRCLALEAEEKGIDWNDAESLAELAGRLDVKFAAAEPEQKVMLGGTDVSFEIRQPRISQGASIVSEHPQVRKALLGLQREFARAGNVVMEGRDIGTVVWPQARVKVFLDASDEVRARRRHRQQLEKGIREDFKQTLEQLRERDRRDSGRSVAPLRPAKDAVVVDTSNLSIDGVVDRIVELARKAMK